MASPITWYDILPAEHHAEFKRISRAHRRKQKRLLFPARERLRVFRHRYIAVAVKIIQL